jgi:hypothetical protein
MQFKEGVPRLLNPVFRGLVEDLDKALDGRLVITSTFDGEHMHMSWHYFGLAFDIRTRSLNDEELGLVEDILVDHAHILLRYGKKLQWVRHPTHIHIEMEER